MYRNYLAIYTTIGILLSAVDFYFAWKSFRKPEKVGKALGWSAMFAGIVTMAYLISVNVTSMGLISFFSSIVFAGIDCMLVSLVYFTFLATEDYGHPTLNLVIRLLAAADITVIISNMSTHVAVDFVLLDPVGVGYKMKPLYVVHLAFTYALVALILVTLIRKIIRTPRQYCNQYLMLLATIILVVAFNAIFLFPETNSFFTKVDCSLLGYSLGLYLMYWAAYDYRINDMLNSMSKIVVESVNQGVVMFDYMDKMIMHNKRARELLTGVEFVKEMPVSDFLSACGITPEEKDRYSTQCDLNGAVPLRMDYRRLKDERSRVTGHLCVFTDISRDTDLTTSFEYLKDPASLNGKSAALAVFDIIGLQEINRERGRDEGDRQIRSLAKMLREVFPDETRFRRGVEAYLIAICPGRSEQEIRSYAEKAVIKSESTVMYGLSSGTETTMAEALANAYLSIRIKKLLSQGSTRSQSLNSLVRALEEADPDTQAHVLRTQKMGAELGRRVGLNDLQMAQLELLCLLHDIGKIGVPLEILNKPGKLTDKEWEVLRTHTEKGYQIAMSADELKSIAEMILSHHERWDGKGYPQGLSGEDIPILSRFISVVDAYDAMVNDRSYRKALKPEYAQNEILTCAGTQFDPQLAGEFLTLLKEKPELAQGEKVGEETAQIFDVSQLTDDMTGFAYPIAYSRYILNSDSLIIEADERFEEITGYAVSDAVGRMTQLELIPPEDRPCYFAQVSDQLSHGNIVYLRHKILCRDGRRVQVACYGKLFYDSAAREHKNEIIIFQL